MEHLSLSKNSRLLLAQKEADVIYWKRKSGVSEESTEDTEQLSVERLIAEKASLEESLVIMGSQLREAIRDSNEIKAMMAKCDDSQGQYDLLKQEFTKLVADAELQDTQKAATIDGLVSEYSKLAAEMEVRQRGESTRLLEVMRENETLATRIRALEHSLRYVHSLSHTRSRTYLFPLTPSHPFNLPSPPLPLSALADRAVLSAIEAEDNHHNNNPKDKDSLNPEHRNALEEGELQGRKGGSGGGVDEGKEKEKQWLVELKEVKARLVNAQFDLKGLYLPTRSHIYTDIFNPLSHTTSLPFFSSKRKRQESMLSQAKSPFSTQLQRPAQHKDQGYPIHPWPLPIPHH